MNSLNIPKIEIPKFDWSQILTAHNLAQQFADSIKEQHARMFAELSQINKVAEQVMAPLAETSKNLSNLFDTGYFKWMKEMAIKMAEEDEKRKDLMIKSGWFLSPVFLDLEYRPVADAFDNYKKGDQLAFYKLVRKTFRYKKFENLNSSLIRWKQSKYFNGRESIIEQALKAHKRGEYFNSVISMLTQIEGIAGEYCAQNPSLKIKQNSSKGKDKLKAALEDKGIDVSFFYKESILNQVESLLFANTGKNIKNFDTALNRHAILHGNVKNFGTEENSYKCILLLDVLSALE